LGRSRGGFSTKIHVAVNGLGLPVELILTPGQQADVTQAEALLNDHRPEAVMADKAYDSDSFIDAVKATGAQVVIPPKANRIEQRDFDRHLYRERNLIERFMNRIKQYRRVATRYDKKAQNFLAFVQVAAIMLLAT
jgi:putative transposase